MTSAAPTTQQELLGPASSDGSSQETTSPPSSETRERDCPFCTSRRGAVVPNRFEQTRDAAHAMMWLPTMCPECSAHQDAELQRIEIERQQAEARMESQRRIDDIRATGIPESYVVGKRGEASLDRGPKTESYRAAREACTDLLLGRLQNAPWIYLCGANGTFKSTLACCTLLKSLQAGMPGRYVLWPDSLDELRALNRDDAPESVKSYIDRLVAIPRLVIDEIGLGTPTSFAAEKLFIMLEKRYQLDSAARPGQRWVIFASNRTVAQVTKSYEPFDEFLMAPRLERRIAEMSTEIEILVEAPAQEEPRRRVSGHVLRLRDAQPPRGPKRRASDQNVLPFMLGVDPNARSTR